MMLMTETTAPALVYTHSDPALPIFPVDRDLFAYLNTIWQHYFSDIPPVNDLSIAYSYPWKSRLGLIRMSLDNTHSFIGINALLQHPQVPESLLITTIAHELVHYAHGFGSPLPRRYEHPHADRVVERELEQRALGECLQHSNEWIDAHWYPFYEQQRANKWEEVLGSPRRVIRRKNNAPTQV